MQAEQFMTGESESYNYSCKVAKKKGGKKGLQLLLPRGSYLFFGSFIPRLKKVIGKARLRLNLL